MANHVATEQRHSTTQSFLEEVITFTPGDARLEMCIQCGTCSGSCPSGPDMDHTPRQIFAMIRAEMRDEVFASNTPWYCVSCYYCMVRCPQDVRITDIMYALKSLAIDANQYKEANAADLSLTFVDLVENYGRSFELGLATRYYLRHQPFSMFGKAQMGLEMLRKNRLDLRPQRIEDVKGLQKILDKAKVMEKEITG